MARIRSIKPEFWTSEQVADCSPTARLLFIGLWTFCDDQGVHPASSKRIKMEVFPADPFTIEQIDGFIDELLQAGLLTEFAVDNEDYYAVTGWKHQKIEKPTNKYPAPPSKAKIADQSPTTRQPVAEPSAPERKGEERRGEDKKDTKKLVSQVVRSATPEAKPSHPTNFDDPANRKARWQQKIESYLYQTLPDHQAKKIVLGYLDQEKWALEKFEEADRALKARQQNTSSAPPNARRAG